MPHHRTIAVMSSACLIAAWAMLLHGCATTAPGQAGGIGPRTQLAVVTIIDEQYIRSLAGSASTVGNDLSPDMRPVSVAPHTDGGAVVLDADGRLLVDIRDSASARSTGTPLRISPAQSREPVCARIDALGHLYLCDAADRRILIFDSQLRPLERMPELPFDALGLAAGRLGGLALGPTGEMYIADQTNGRVYELDAAGGFVRTLGDGEQLWARLQRPIGLAVGRQDRAVYVCDAALGCIVVFESDGSPRAVLGGGHLKEPVAVTIDARGRCIVADRKAMTLVVLSRHGELERTIDGADLDVSPFGGPTDVVLSDSTLWIADPPTGRVLQVRLREPTGD